MWKRCRVGGAWALNLRGAEGKVETVEGNVA